MTCYTITVKKIGCRPEVQHVDLPGLPDAKRMTIRIGADLVGRAAVPGDEWRLELTDNGRVLLSFNVQARTAALAAQEPLGPTTNAF